MKRAALLALALACAPAPEPPPDAGACVTAADCPQFPGVVLNVCVIEQGGNVCRRLCDAARPCFDGSTCYLDPWSLVSFCTGDLY